MSTHVRSSDLCFQNCWVDLKKIWHKWSLCDPIKIVKIILIHQQFFLYYVQNFWRNGRVLDSRPRGHGFEPHRCHCVVSLSKNINPSLVLVQPRKTWPYITERLLMGHKESNQTIFFPKSSWPNLWGQFVNNLPQTGPLVTFYQYFQIILIC